MKNEEEMKKRTIVCDITVHGTITDGMLGFRIAEDQSSEDDVISCDDVIAYLLSCQADLSRLFGLLLRVVK